jgi:hypothetical protein
MERQGQFALQRGACPENAPFEGAFLQEIGVIAAHIGIIGGRPPGLRPPTGPQGILASPRRNITRRPGTLPGVHAAPRREVSGVGGHKRGPGRERPEEEGPTVMRLESYVIVGAMFVATIWMGWQVLIA